LSTATIHTGKSKVTQDYSRRSVIKGLCFGAALGVPGLWSSLRRPERPVDGEVTDSERTAMAVVAESFRRKFDAPGLSVAIARQGSLQYAEAFGTIGHESRQPLTTSGLFRIASVSKPITSAAIFALIEDGHLRIDDTVFGPHGILGTRYGRQPYARDIERITVDHLLTHSSGGWGFEHDPMFSNPSMSQPELISWALDTQPPPNSPGKVFAYSNFGYCLLGRVVEQVSGRAYADDVQTRILSRSGIVDMRIAGNSLRERATDEVAYYGETDGSFSDPYGINVSRMDSHGGWIATPTDLVHFALHVDGFDPRRNILRPDTIARMSSPSSTNPGYARGWNVNAKGHWWHGGDLPGTSAILVRTSSHFCWAALTNTRAGHSPQAIDDLVWEMVSRVGAWKSA
jgi:CubicO group peptidase (beta-lactamase class C family)